MTISISHLLHPKYRPDIDGLRAIAVLSVVAFHAFPSWMAGGFIGVDVFFVISGFLISTIIFENLDRGTFNFSEFYVRRIKRIFPALLLVLAVTYLIGWFTLLADEYKQLGKHLAAGAGFVSNLVLWSEAGYFDNSVETKTLLHLWSLGVEEQFYIVWPFILWFAWKKKLNLLTFTVIVALMSFALNFKGVKQNPVATFYSPQTRFWELLSGSILAWIVLYSKNSFTNYKSSIDGWLTKLIYRETVDTNGVTFSNIISFVGSLLLVYGFCRINKDVSFPGKWAVIPVLGTMLIILAGQKAWVNRTILSNKIVVWFGLISFPLYLWHWPLLSFARIVEIGIPSLNIRIMTVALSVVMAWLTYKLVEHPVRTGNSGKVIVAVLIVFMATLGFAGYNTYERDGLKFRNKVRSTSVFVSDLAGIPNVYDFYKYGDVVRNGVCHSVSFDSFKRNKCLDLRKKNIFILGDSYAASLFSGMNYVRNKEFRDIGITQMTDGNGPPFFTSGKTDDGKTLIEANNNRLEIVKEVRPDMIITTWMVGGKNAVRTKDESVSEINKTIDKLLAVSPASKIIVVGPFPKWMGTLRQQLLDYYGKHKSLPPYYLSSGLVTEDRDFDLFFSQNIRRKNVVYISSYDYLCSVDGCLTRVSDSALDLTAVDWGHLTNAGSIYLVNKIKSLVFNF